MKKYIKLSNAISVVIIIAVMLVSITVAFLMNDHSEEVNVSDAVKQLNKNKTYNFLLLGRDDAARLCDVIILASFNLDNGDVSIMQIPRDTYFDCNGASYKRINGAYNSLGSAAAVADALSQALGIKIDYYLSLDLEAVEGIVDNLGGIDVDVPVDMDYDDPDQGLSIHLSKGKQRLDGKSAVEFLRYRAGYITGDLGRIDAQKLFLNAFVQRISEIKDPFALYNTFKMICDLSENNLRISEIVSIGLKCAKLKSGAVYYLTAPGEAVQSAKSGAWYYVLSAPSMNEILDARFDSNEKFDKESKFVDSGNKAFCDIYGKSYEIKIYTKDDIENNKININ